jgi:hypothetical protein
MLLEMVTNEAAVTGISKIHDLTVYPFLLCMCILPATY